jgi:hypothetical protein
LPKLKQIYRFLAATALIAVMANVALPSALATVQYICNADYTELSESSDFGECCSSSSVDNGVHHTTDLKEEFCVTEQVCEQELTTVFSKTHVILPEVPQPFATLIMSGSSLLSSLTNRVTPLTLNNVVPFSKPPLFLLNSVFLN